MTLRWSARHRGVYSPLFLLFLLPCFNLITVLYKEVYVVESVFKAMLLVSVYLKMLALACSEVCHGLIGQVYLHLCLVVLVDAGKEFLKEFLAHHYRQHKIVEFVVLVDVGKERADDHTESGSGMKM